MEKCELCAFRNPKATATAIIIKDQKILVLKRNEEPFKGEWDLPGGYLNEGEIPEECIVREMKEELGIDVISNTFIKNISGLAFYDGEDFPVLNSFFLMEIKGDIKLNDENSEYDYVPLKDLKTIAFDTNQKILPFLHDNFVFNLDEVKALVGQLDDSVEFYENGLYKAVLDGCIAREYNKGKLVGMGWIFIRQTMLRKQGVIEDMVVNESQRGKGLGRKILKNLIEWARIQGVDTIELTTGHHRVAAGKLYLSEGFKLHNTRHMLLKI